MARAKGLHCVIEQAVTFLAVSSLLPIMPLRMPTLNPATQSVVAKCCHLPQTVDDCGRVALAQEQPAIVWPGERASCRETNTSRVGSAENCLHTALGQLGCPLSVPGTDALPGG